jgi:hypothetical protein
MSIGIYHTTRLMKQKYCTIRFPRMQKKYATFSLLRSLRSNTKENVEPHELSRHLILIGFANVVNAGLNIGKQLSFLIRNLHVEFFLQSHDQFYSIKRVSTEIINKTRFVLNLLHADTKLLNNDSLYLVVDRKKLGADAGATGYEGIGSEGRSASYEECDKSLLEHG